MYTLLASERREESGTLLKLFLSILEDLESPFKIYEQGGEKEVNAIFPYLFTELSTRKVKLVDLVECSYSKNIILSSYVNTALAHRLFPCYC